MYNFKNISTNEIAEYDPFMGLYYIKGKESTPFTYTELQKSENWLELCSFTTEEINLALQAHNIPAYYVEVILKYLKQHKK